MEKIYITTFGGFSLTYGKNTLAESRRSNKMWALLEYIILNKGKEILREELVEITRKEQGLFGKKDTEKPVNALKMQMHRLRRELSRLGTDMPLIVNIQDSYEFNPQADYTMDCEEFERLYNEALNEEDKKAVSELLLKALNLYKGDFLPNLENESWVKPLNIYYRSLFVKITLAACVILEEQDKIETAINLLKNAVVVDPYDAKLHETFIGALIKAGDYQGARAHYGYVTNLFYTTFGVNPPDEIMNMYDEIMKGEENAVSGFEEIAVSLNENIVKRGALYCEYEIFRKLYQLEARYADRINRGVSIFLLTITAKNNKTPEKRALNRGMVKLSEIIGESLRSSDVYSRYGVSQYIILLHGTNTDSCEMIIKRLERRYNRECPRGAEVLRYEFMPIKEFDKAENENAR